MIERVGAFVDGADQHNDMTVILLRLDRLPKPKGHTARVGA